MCIQTRIQKILAEKEALDAQIIRLEKLETATTPVKNLLAELLADYAQEAPEDLAAVWEEVLAIGQSHNLSVQPWEFVNPALSLLKAELEKAQTEIAEQDRAWGELSDERDDLEATLAEVRSQIPTPTIRADYELATGNDASELSKAQCERQLEIWSKESITPELEKLYQEALPETDSEATLTNEEYAAAVEEELGLDDDGKDIPALTLWQPWATLIEQEVKRVETRSWATNYRGPIAIHAAKKPVAVSDYPHLFELVSYGCEFPFGAVVAIANLVNCVEMTEEFIAQQSETELKCGDWSPGRFAWILEIIRPVVPPIPATGGQKIWNWSGTSIEAELENLEVPGQLNLELPNPTSEQIEEELGCNWEDEEETAPEQTELQKLLAGNSDFTLEELGVHVNFQPVTAAADDTVDFESEKVLITVTYAQQTREYDEDAQDFIRNSDIEETAENYAKHFLLELKKESEIQEKICRWKADDARLIESVDPEIQESEIDGRFTMMGLKVEVHLQPPTGLTFRFLNPDNNTLVFSNSLITAEIAGRTWKVCAGDLITVHRERESARLERIANPYATEEDKFIELVKLSPAVGYIKRRDNGEMLSAYAAFANRDAAGEKTVTLAKSRSKKWAEYLHSSFESCGWKVEEPRKINRMVAELGARQQFAYEIKITGKFSIGQLQKLAEEDFSLLPGEVAATETVATVPPAPASTQDYRVRVNGYDLATGTEEEMRSRFEQELKILGGSQMSVSLLTGSEVVESYRISDFEFTQIEKFDTANPKYETTYLPSQKTFKVYKNLGLEGYPISMSGWTNTLYPYTPGFTQRVAAAADAIRRLSKAQNAAE